MRHSGAAAACLLCAMAFTRDCALPPSWVHTVPAPLLRLMCRPCLILLITPLRSRQGCVGGPPCVPLSAARRLVAEDPPPSTPPHTLHLLRSMLIPEMPEPLCLLAIAPRLELARCIQASLCGLAPQAGCRKGVWPWPVPSVAGLLVCGAVLLGLRHPLFLLVLLLLLLHLLPQVPVQLNWLVGWRNGRSGPGADVPVTQLLPRGSVTWVAGAPR
mmetsp:Transcript_42068/g.125856  ORF Transcript_42068/g.125856 Transcript_42068/m.125856 type:complete len:215 (+) Transcript_42068:126-770(+)